MFGLPRYSLDWVHHQWRLAVFGIWEDICCQEVSFWWQESERRVALIWGRDAQSSTMRLDIQLPQHVTVPSDIIKRRISHQFRTILFLWKSDHAGVPVNIPRGIATRRLMIQCDGSGGTHWGVGISIPFLHLQYSSGGSAKRMEYLMIKRQFDSAVVEALALAYALHIAFKMSSRTEDFTGALVVVDNTSVPAAVLAGYELPARLQHAVAHIRRNASKVLMAGWSIKVLHKGVYGYKKTWNPDRLAFGARDSGLAWAPSKAALCEVRFDNAVYGNFQGKQSSSKELDPTVLCAVDITAELLLPA